MSARCSVVLAASVALLAVTGSVRATAVAAEGATATVATPAAAPHSAGQAKPGSQPEPLDLTQASEVELRTLPGVGPARAQAIVAYRKAHGFRRITDLMRVKGIGLRTFSKLKPLVRIGPTQASGASASSSSPVSGGPVAPPGRTGAS